MEAVRINIRRLATVLLLTLLLPLAVALLADLNLEWMPYLTIGATVIFVPLSTVFVIRTILAELDLVIQQVAPSEPEASHLPVVGAEG
jgi:hypothetical protein